MFQVEVEPHVREDIHAVATACGISSGWFVEMMASHLLSELDENGRPTWFVDPFAHEADQELPLKTA